MQLRQAELKHRHWSLSPMSYTNDTACEHIHVAMSTLYLHRDFSKDAHHIKVFKLAT